jgi:hypothetical protein
MGYAPPPPPPARKTNWLAIIVLVGIVAAIGGGYWLFRDRLSGSVAELAVGDCFDRPTATTEISDVQHQPCNSPHDAEVVATGNHPAPAGAPQLAESDLRSFMDQTCKPAFEAYTGLDYDNEPNLDYGLIYPTDQGWTDGDRGYTCYLFQVDETQLTRSLRASGSSPQS